jgi:hypothetical protein
MKLKIENSKDLELLDGLIHDQDYDTEKFEFDEALRVLKMPFERETEPIEPIIRHFYYSTFRIPVIKCVTSVNNVRSYKIIDRENRRDDMFNEVLYDQKTNKLTFKPCINIRIEAVIDKLEIEFEDVGTIIGERISRQIFLGESTSETKYFK